MGVGARQAVVKQPLSAVGLGSLQTEAAPWDASAVPVHGELETCTDRCCCCYIQGDRGVSRSGTGSTLAAGPIPLIME